jgi:NTP pyrophosphatase (non-canonical NTP hydrolase)
MKNTDFNLLDKQAFESAKKKGFHDVAHTEGHYIMLVACELAEAVEADRRGRRADKETYKMFDDPDKSPRLFEEYIKDSVEDELADAAIRLLDFIGMKSLTIQKGFIDQKQIQTVLNETFRAEWSEVQTLAERLFIACIANIGNAILIPESTLFSIFCVAELYEIDLLWFIREKMKYNEYREHLHEKKY